MNIMPYLSIRFVDSSWLAPSELTMAALYWVVGVELSMDRLHEALRAGLPTILPGEREDLKALCNDSSSRYTYRTASEAAESIARILGKAPNGIGLSKRAQPAPGTAAKHATAGDR